jgi:TatD DNase family protein
VAVEPSPLPLVDIGANLTHASFRADFDAVLDRAHKANVRAIILTGSSSLLRRVRVRACVCVCVC